MYKILGFEIFETIILVLVGLGIVVFFIKVGTNSKQWMEKWKDMKNDREEKKYQAYCNKFGATATTSSAHHTGPKSKTKNKTRMHAGKLSYESGDPVDDFYQNSDEGTV